MISIYQPNKVDKLTLLSRSFKLEVREFVAWDNLVWISGPKNKCSEVLCPFFL